MYVLVTSESKPIIKEFIMDSFIYFLLLILLHINLHEEG